VAVRTLLTRPGLLKTLLSKARLAARLMREPRVPLYAKAVLILAAFYLVSPLDFIPDVLPIVGQVDDLAIAVVALQFFLFLCPSAAVTFHRDAIAQGRRFSRMSGPHDVIDAEWRREE
jgi:uncharacterized membrane protein YkvA (DUF1232 family)